MEQKTSNGNYFDSTSLFEFFWRWRKPLIIIGITAAICSSIVSFLIHERYKSSVIMFPVQSNAIAKALLTDDVSGKQDILQFGEEAQAEAGPSPVGRPVEGGSGLLATPGPTPAPLARASSS